jgi:ubiquinone/menaquinone biosynthesis C-methylase UbiE
MNERTFKASDAQRLEDPARRESLPPDEVIERLALTPETVVADIGAGTGYFAIPMALKSRQVFAVDLQREMLELLRVKMNRVPQIGNIEPVHGSALATNLAAASCDLAFFANVWHELDSLDAVLAEALRIVRHGGRIAILDWRPDVDRPPGPPIDHRIPAEQVQKALSAAGLTVDPVFQAGCYHYLVVAGLAG